jgi:hypothetical protein
METLNTEILHYDITKHKKYFTEKGSMNTYFDLYRRYKNARKDGLLYEHMIQSEQCAICHDYIINQSIDCFLCCHIFHEKCLNPWLESFKNVNDKHCPLCRHKGSTYKGSLRLNLRWQLDPLESEFKDIINYDLKRKAFHRSIIMSQALVDMVKKITNN